MAKDSNGGVEVEEDSHTSKPTEVAIGDSANEQLVAETSSIKDEALEATNEDDEQDSTIRAATSQQKPLSAAKASNTSGKDEAGGPSPYGTRSRNRAGTSRPNYAEDREVELEFEVQPPVKEEDGRRGARNGEVQSSSNETHTTQPAPSRRGPIVVDQAPPAPGLVKDQIPGTSTFQAHPTTNGSSQAPKKQTRKAAAPTNSTATSNTHASSSQPVTRRGSISTQVMNGLRETCMLSFDNCRSMLKDGKLIADDGTILSVNDHAYLVCEPPGDPYYLGRVMEFLHVDNDRQKPVDSLRMNWYYRPRDIGRRSNDTRQIYASMHSDICPLTSLRGGCEIRHKSEVPNMDEYRRQQNCFWYDKMYDRYIHRYYEVVPTSVVVNVPAKVKRVLNDRWRYILVEPGRGKELTSAVKSCKRCSGYCASNDSVDCAVCHQTYHMNCVRPPLLKKPSRGFAWACGPCSRAQERKMQERNTPNVNEAGLDVDDEEIIDEDEDDGTHGDGSGTGISTPEGSGDADLSVHPGTPEQIYQASLWPFRYLGIHCKVEDALDYDDRIYPRASSRLGTRHQADVAAWPGRPFEFVKPIEIKKKYIKGGNHKKDAKLSKETTVALEADKVAREQRPKWVVDEPPGYLERGQDLSNDDPNNTAYSLFKPPTDDQLNSLLAGESGLDNKELKLHDFYMTRAEPFAKRLGVANTNTNWMDKAINILWESEFDLEVALRQLATVQKQDLKNPELTSTEVKKFEDGVAKHGSELVKVKKHVKTLSPGDIVRYYYVWKKSDKGRQVWGKFGGRKGKKSSKSADAATDVIKLQDDVADEFDDSAFDNEKAAEKKRGFQCKFCSTRSSRQWRRAPQTAPGTTIPADPNNKTTGKDKSAQLMVALCINCAIVWRKYAVQWEESEDSKKGLANGGRAGKRKAEDPLREFQLNEMNLTAHNTDAANTPNTGTPVPQAPPLLVSQEPARKKLKSGVDKDQTDSTSADSGGVVTSGQQRKKLSDQPVVPPVEVMPKPKLLPCAVCQQLEPLGDQHVSCKECRLTVHRACYGIMGEARGSGKWLCDMCSNDRAPQVSVQYKCVLCPIYETVHDFVEQPKPSHRKKNEKDRERDRVELELSQKAAAFYQSRQAEMKWPANPRDPLKRTSHNNWVHVACAIWTPEVKFGNAKALSPSEGIGSIPFSRYSEVCKICHIVDEGACVQCHTCKAPVHVGCANQNGYILGFDINPVKGSRRDVINTVSINGETVSMTAAVWCKEHPPAANSKSRVYRMHELLDDSGTNALQLFAQHFKQADLTLTGTVRKASQVVQPTKQSHVAATNPASSLPNRRASTTTAQHRGSISGVKMEDMSNGSSSDILASTSVVDVPKCCITCDVDVSPRWWPYHPSSVSSNAVSGGTVLIGSVQSITNGESTPVVGQEVALAKAGQAAMADTPSKVKSEVKEWQCHKCHHNKIEKKAPSPPRPAAVLRPLNPPIAPITVPLASPAVVTSPPPSQPPAQVSSRYNWPSPTPAYSPTYPYQNSWTRQSPGPPQSASLHYGANHSPRTTSGSSHGLVQPAQRPTPSSSQSPYMNGIGTSASNGYQHPPHRSVSGHPISTTSPYTSYTSHMPSPQTLTNGGPPPRASDYPFVHPPPVHQYPYGPYIPPRASPPVSRDGPVDPRDNAHSSAGPRPENGRVNGGASASPSLHNLLS